jgi:hypothetical protein
VTGAAPPSPRYPENEGGGSRRRLCPSARTRSQGRASHPVPRHPQGPPELSPTPSVSGPRRPMEDSMTKGKTELVSVRAADLAAFRPMPRLPPAVVEDRLAEWRRLLRSSNTQGRAVLQRVVRGRITFAPREDGSATTSPRPRGSPGCSRASSPRGRPGSPRGPPAPTTSASRTRTTPTTAACWRRWSAA